MSAPKIIEGNGVGGAPQEPDDPKGAEHTPSAILRPGKPVLAGAGAVGNETQQVNMDFSNTSFDDALEDLNAKETSEAAKAGTTKIGNNKDNLEAANGYTTNIEDIDMENSILSISKSSDDNFDNELSGNNKLAETSKVLADLTIVSPATNDSNIVKEKRVQDSGAARAIKKRARKEAEKREREANETEEETVKRKYIEKEYSVRNKSYAQAAKAAGGKMLEVRSHNQEYLLEQEDFNFIDTECGMKFFDLWTNGETIEYEITGGLSQGGVWISCKNMETLTIVKEFVGTLMSPAELGGRYKVFGEDEKPYMYLQAWIPDRWWNRREQLFPLIKFSNRWLVNPLEDGQIPHFRLSSGLNKKKSNDYGFFEVTFEIDENLFPVIAQKKGSFKISMTETKFFGSGMVAAAKRLLGEEWERSVQYNAE